MNYKFFISLMIVCFCLSFVSAYKLNTSIDIKIPTNATNCNITVTWPNSSNAVTGQAMIINFGYAHYTLNNFLVDNSGEYSYFSECGHGSFSVTPNGEEATTGKAVFYIGLLFVLLFFLGITLYFFFDTDSIMGKVIVSFIAYLLFVSLIFISWNMASDFLTSSPFLIDMLRIMFLILIISFFPFVIGMVIWYINMKIKIKDIENFMGKGMSYDEANKRSGHGGKY